MGGRVASGLRAGRAGGVRHCGQRGPRHRPGVGARQDAQRRRDRGPDRSVDGAAPRRREADRRCGARSRAGLHRPAPARAEHRQLRGASPRRHHHRAGVGDRRRGHCRLVRGPRGKSRRQLWREHFAPVFPAIGDAGAESRAFRRIARRRVNGRAISASARASRPAASTKGRLPSASASPTRPAQPAKRSRRCSAWRRSTMLRAMFTCAPITRTSAISKKSCRPPRKRARGCTSFISTAAPATASRNTWRGFSRRAPRALRSPPSAIRITAALR